METVYRLKVSELGMDFIHSLKTLFKNADELDIIVHKTKALNKKETREEYWARIDRAINDVKNNRNLIRFTGEEYEAMMKKMLEE